MINVIIMIFQPQSSQRFTQSPQRQRHCERKRSNPENKKRLPK